MLRNPRGGGRPESGASLASRGLGVPRDKVARALRIAGLSDEAKAGAVETGLDAVEHAPLRVWGQDQPKMTWSDTRVETPSR